MRTVTVRVEWESEHEIEVPDDTPPLGRSDLDALLDASGDDVTPTAAWLTDWDVRDPAA